MPVYLDDKICKDGALVLEDYQDELERHIRHDEVHGSRIPMSRMHEAKKDILDIVKRSEGKFETESWFRRACDEAKWVSDVWWHDKPHGVAWSVQNKTYVRAHMSYTLFVRLEEIATGGIVYSDDVKGWVLTGVDRTSPDFIDVLADYQIVSAPGLEGDMEGSGKWEEELRKHFQAAVEMGYDVPNMFKTDRTYKRHQEQSVVAMAGMGSVLLADQVGLGKGGSFVGGWLSKRQYDIEMGLAGTDESSTDGPLLVVTTRSMKYEIAEEITKWKQDAVVEILEQRAQCPVVDGVEFIVTNIDLLSFRLDDILEANPMGMVIDESHMVKNAEALRTQAAMAVSEHIRKHSPNPYIVLASGTPFLNRPIELWSQLKILGVHDRIVEHAQGKVPDFMKIRTKKGWRKVPTSDARAFEIRWCNGHFDNYKQWHNDGASNTAELNRLLLETCMVRRRKSDVMHPLPALEEKVITIDGDEFDPEFKEYIRMEQEFRDWAKQQAATEAEENGFSIKQALKIVSRKLDNAEHGMRFAALRQAIARYKIGKIVDWVHDFMRDDSPVTGGDPTRRKLIIFAYHREIQQLLLDDPDLQDYGMTYIVSGQSMDDIQEHKRLFQKDPDYRVMICYMGAREGHTLTACKDILLAELPFVPSWIVQMAGRCWARFSEDYDPHEAYIHYALVPNTVDTVVFQKNRIKKAMFNSVIDGEGIEELEKIGEEGKEADMFLELVASGSRKITIAA